jgi:hypothetical protein
MKKNNVILLDSSWRKMLQSIANGSIASSKNTNAFSIIRESIHNNKFIGIKCSTKNLGICKSDIYEIISCIQNTNSPGLVYDKSINAIIFQNVINMFNDLIDIIETYENFFSSNALKLAKILKKAYNVIQIELISEELNLISV